MKEKENAHGSLSEDESSSSSEDSNNTPDLEIEAPSTMEADYSAVEDQQMGKVKTIYIYNSKRALEEALEECAHVSGVLATVDDLDPSANANEVIFLLLYRKRDRVSFGCYEVTFKDAEGVNIVGLWYAPMEAKESAIFRHDFNLSLIHI